MNMVDRNNSLLFLGKNSFIQQQLRNYFLAKNYRFIETKDIQNKAFIPVMFPSHANDMDAAIEWMKQNKSTDQLLFIVHTHVNLNMEKLDTLNEMTDSIIEIKINGLEKCDEAPQMKKMITKIGISMEYYINHPPTEDHITTEVSLHEEEPTIGV